MYQTWSIPKGSEQALANLRLFHRAQGKANSDSNIINVRTAANMDVCKQSKVRGLGSNNHGGGYSRQLPRDWLA